MSTNWKQFKVHWEEWLAKYTHLYIHICICAYVSVSSGVALEKEARNWSPEKVTVAEKQECNWNITFCWVLFLSLLLCANTTFQKLINWNIYFKILSNFKGILNIEIKALLVSLYWVSKLLNPKEGKKGEKQTKQKTEKVRQIA